MIIVLNIIISIDLPYSNIGNWTEINSHYLIIGKCERDEVKPSIEMDTQLAESLEVSLDYLVGSIDTLLEKNIVDRVLDIQKLKDNSKQHVFAL